MQVLAIERQSGRNHLSAERHKTIWFVVIGFLIFCAIILLVQDTPQWLELALGSLFVAFASFDFFIQRGKKLSGYFAFVIGALILVGIFT